MTFSATAEVLSPEQELLVFYTALAGGYEEELLHTAEAAARHTWFIIGRDKELDKIRGQQSISINRRVFLASMEGDMTVDEVYAVGRRVVTNTIGHFTRLGGGADKLLTYNHADGLPGFLERRSNFRGATFDVMTDQQPPFLYIQGRRNGLSSTSTKEGWIRRHGQDFMDLSRARLSGPLYEILQVLEKRLNFTSRLWWQESPSFGRPDSNGSWTGMIGNLLRGEADFVAASVTVTAKRHEVVDFLHPLGSETIAAYLPAARSFERREWLSFLYPLRREVWLGLLVNCIVVLMILKLLEGFSSIKTGKGSWPLSKTMIATTVGDFWMLGASYFGRKPVDTTAYDDYERDTKLRMLLVMMFLSGNIVFMSYRASLTAELSVKRHKLPFTSAKELLASDFRYLLYYINFMKTSTTSRYTY